MTRAKENGKEIIVPSFSITIRKDTLKKAGRKEVPILPSPNFKTKKYEKRYLSLGRKKKLNVSLRLGMLGSPVSPAPQGNTHR